MAKKITPTPRPRKTAREYGRTMIALPIPIYERLARLADAGNRPVTKELLIALDRYFAERDGEKNS